MHSTSDLLDLVQENRRAAAEVASLLAEAEHVQWSPAPVLRPRDEGGSRAAGTVSDPTSDTATDPRRLALREEVEDAARAVQKSTKTLLAAHKHLGDALDAWAGHTDD